MIRNGNVLSFHQPQESGSIGDPVREIVTLAPILGRDNPEAAPMVVTILRNLIGLRSQSPHPAPSRRTVGDRLSIWRVFV
jgi:hypothetical protein